MFSRDTKKVLAILKEIKLYTDTETWMKGKYFGREEILSLQNHYDIKSEGERRKQVAKDDLKRLFYSNESTFSFEKCVNNMKQGLNVLKNYNKPLYEEDNFSPFLDNIVFQNNDLKIEVNICRSIHSASFDTSTTYLLTVILRLFAEIQTS